MEPLVAKTVASASSVQLLKDPVGALEKQLDDA